MNDFAQICLVGEATFWNMAKTQIPEGWLLCQLPIPLQFVEIHFGLKLLLLVLGLDICQDFFFV